MGLGSRIRVPRSEKTCQVPDPGVEKAPAPGSQIRIRNTVIVYPIYEFLCLKIVQYIVTVKSAHNSEDYLIDSMRSSTGVDCFLGPAHSFLSPACNRAILRQI